jgi:HD superfamily phosphohydrolase
MEVRDPVHGSIRINDEEVDIIHHPFFQRLRNIKQLGFSEFVFPGATHTRYIHSIGVMDIATKVFHQLFKDFDNTSEIKKLRESVRLAALLHDIGHAPLSHSTETVMPKVSELKLPKQYVDDQERQATHEDYTLKSIVDSSFTSSFTKVRESFGVECEAVADLILGKTTNKKYFTINGINYFPVLHQLVSSEMDCDRMDYLLRDSYFCGVSYGHYDLDWLIDNLSACISNNEATLGIDERAVATFDDFLLSRFHMFLQVYFHYRAVCLEQMLYRYFKTAHGEYKIPADIEAYLEHDDHFLMKVLRKSSNTWAKRIILNDIPKKIFETFSEDQAKTMNQLETFLNEQNIDYIKCSSSGRLSKYYTSESVQHDHHVMKVVRKQSIGTSKVIRNINQATNLYEKYSKSHKVERVHCDFSQLSPSTQKKIIDIISI